MFVDVHPDVQGVQVAHQDQARAAQDGDVLAGPHVDLEDGAGRRRPDGAEVEVRAGFVEVGPGQLDVGLGGLDRRGRHFGVVLVLHELLIGRRRGGGRVALVRVVGEVLLGLGLDEGGPCGAREATRCATWAA